MKWKAVQSFHVCSGTEANSFASACIALFSPTTTLFDLAEAELGERAVPLQLRRERAQLRAGHRIVDFLDVAALLGRPMDFAIAVSSAMMRSARASGSADPGEPLKLDQIIAIGLAIGVIFRALEQVIIAVGHAEAVLRRVNRIARRVLEVG